MRIREIDKHIELAEINHELKTIDARADDAYGDEFELLCKTYRKLQLQGKRLANELQLLMIKRDNCNSQKHLMLKKYPEKYKTLSDLDFLDEEYGLETKDTY